MINKLNILKKMLHKKIFVITDHEKCEGYIGYVQDIKDENNLLVKNQTESLSKVNIFDVRSIPYEF